MKTADDARREGFVSWWQVPLCLLFLLSPICVPTSAGADGTPKRPNIVVIMADDLGWSDLGSMGGEIDTPHIDRLAEEGLRLTHFYTNSVCGPTRCSLLTGLYPQQLGHTGRRWNGSRDYSRAATFAELLSESGYHTMMVGKWQDESPPARRGFKRFFGPYTTGRVSFFHEVKTNLLYLDDKRWKVPEEGFFLTDALTDHAVRFLAEAREIDKPFLLYAAYYAPHWPLHAREKDIAPYRARYLERGWDHWRAERFRRQREMGLIPENWKLSARPGEVKEWSANPHKAWEAERMAVYAAQVTCMDRGIGRILETLEMQGTLDNTVVLFLSDNGPSRRGGVEPWSDFMHFAERQPVRDWRVDGGAIYSGTAPEFLPGPANTFAAYGKAWANVSNTPFYRFKQSGYEGGLLTPLVVRWPGVTKPGEITRQISHLADILPTLLEIAGASYPVRFEGRQLLPPEGTSLVPVFRGETRAPPARLCFDTPRNEAMREGRWKIVRAARGEPWELYDLEEDGTETTNLAVKYPDRVKAMVNRFDSWKERVGAK